MSSTVGDSVVSYFSTKNHNDWNINNLVAVGILHNPSDLSVIQSGISGVTQINNSLVSEQQGNEGFDVHFNSISNQLTIYIHNSYEADNYEIVSLSGQIIQRGSLSGNISYVGLSNLPQGVYLIECLTTTTKHLQAL